jgi:hypothetical protein
VPPSYHRDADIPENLRPTDRSPTDVHTQLLGARVTSERREIGLPEVNLIQLTVLVDIDGDTDNHTVLVGILRSRDFFSERAMTFSARELNAPHSSILQVQNAHTVLSSILCLQAPRNELAKQLLLEESQ